MKKVIVSAFALIMFATVSHAQDVKKSGTATQTLQTAPAKATAQVQPAQPQSANNNTQSTANKASADAKQPQAADKKTEATPQAK